MSIAVAIFLFLHGVAHLVGFVVPWKLAELPDAPYRTTLFDGGWDVGHKGIRIVGTLWLFTAVTFAVCAVGLVMGMPWWPRLTLATAVFSLVMSILGWPQAKIGIPINAVIIAALLFKLWSEAA